MYKKINKPYTDMLNVPIDLRDDAFKLINEFGIDMLYVRNCKFVRCKCFNDLDKTGDPNCPLCMGMGHFASVQMVKSFESQVSSYSTSNVIKQESTGVTNQKTEVWYLEHKYTPKVRDVLLKVTWDSKKNPVDVLQVLEITNTYEMRGDNGRLELVGCMVDDRTDLMIPYNKALKRLTKKGIAALLKGGKYIWSAALLNIPKHNEKN